MAGTIQIYIAYLAEKPFTQITRNILQICIETVKKLKFVVFLIICFKFNLLLTEATYRQWNIQVIKFGLMLSRLTVRLDTRSTLQHHIADVTINIFALMQAI